MKLFRISNVLILCMATGLGSALFWTSQSVQKKQAQLAELVAQSRGEQETISVLATEWDYLNRPQRLEKLAREYLGVRPPEETSILTDASVIAEPSFPILPPSKPAVIPAVVRASAPAAPPAHAPIIEKNDSEKFHTLLQNLNGGGE